MRPIVFIVPGHLETRTGGYEYDRRIVAGLRARGWPVVVQELAGGFPHPAPAALRDAARVLAAIPDSLPDGPLVLIDGLALGAMPAEVEREASRLSIVALVHLPLAAEVGLDAATAGTLRAGERRALAAAALVVVTGNASAALLGKYGVEPARMAIVEPGTDRAALARGSGGGPLQLLSVGTVSAGKGHEILVRALAAVPGREWRLACAGSLERDRRTADDLRRLLREVGLEDRVSLAGELNAAALAACYDGADVFVLATRFETYGMAVAEAVAHGLPVISTATGAIPDLVGVGTGNPAGLVVPPDDARAFAGALSRVLGDAELRARLASNARCARERLPTWDQAVDKMASALGAVDPDGGERRR